MSGWRNHIERDAFHAAWFSYVEASQPIELPSKIPEHHKQNERTNTRKITQADGPDESRQ